MRHHTVAPLLGATLAMLGAFFAVTAHASAAGTPLELCNQTSTTINVAVSYYSTGPNDTSTELTGPIVSTGWWVISPSGCTSIANPFGARYMYWWGYYSGGGSLWSTDSEYNFCTPSNIGSAGPPEFTMSDQNQSQSACTGSAQYDSAGPNMWVPSREVDIEVAPTVDFNGQ